MAALAASPAVADKAPRPDPSELWRAYPLEQTPSSTLAKPAAASGTAQRQSNAALAGPTSAASHGQSSSGPWAALIAGVVAVALVVLTATALRRRHRSEAVPTGPRAMPSPPSSTRNGRAAAARKSPVCQIHWDRRRRAFYAVSVDDNGFEHMVASSRPLESLRPGPPPETPETRAAIRRLARELRNKGWRPLRAKGIDFEERRWYARRFRWPTEAELAEAEDAEHAEAADAEPLEADEVTHRSGGT